MQEIRSSKPPVVTRICDPNNLEHDTIVVWNLARSWSISKKETVQNSYICGIRQCYIQIATEMLYKKLTENELYNNLKQVSMADFLQKQTIIMCYMLYNHFC